jgi:hypothetical protein
LVNAILLVAYQRGNIGDAKKLWPQLPEGLAFVVIKTEDLVQGRDLEDLVDLGLNSRIIPAGPFSSASRMTG